MMNSYHYCYYYCYGYDDYPSYCCCSILLNDFLSLDEHDLLHLETPLLFAHCSWERLFERKTPSTLCYLHPAIDFQTSLSCAMDCHFGSSDHGFHQYDSITWTWCSCRLTLLFTMTSSVPQQCMDYAHYWNAPCWFISASRHHLNQWLFALPTGF